MVVGRIAGLIAAGGLVVACSAPATTVTRDGVTIHVHGTGFARGGMDAIVEGTLARRGGCAVLTSPDGDRAHPVVWPAGTSIVTGDPLSLSLPSGDQASIGDVVSGGGGYLSPDDVDADVDTCLPDADEVAVFNPGDDPTAAGG